jgi:hypothetical protein
VTSMLDPDARDLLRLAKLAEQALPRDPERVRQRVLVAVGAAVATSSVVSHGAAVGAVAKTTGVASSHAALAASWVPGLVKTVAVVSGLALAGGAAYRLGAAKSPGDASLARLTSSAQRPSVKPAQANANPVRPASIAPVNVAPVNAVPLNAVPLNAVPLNAVPLNAVPTTSPRQDSSSAKVHTAQDALRASPPAISSAGAPAQGSKRDAEPTAAEDPAPAPSSDSLSADLRTLSAAQQAFNAGAPARTLALLRELRGNELLAERSALEVFALCALGQTDAAAQKAALFRAIASSSPLLPRVNASCAKP